MTLACALLLSSTELSFCISGEFTIPLFDSRGTTLHVHSVEMLVQLYDLDGLRELYNETSKLVRIYGGIPAAQLRCPPVPFKVAAADQSIKAFFPAKRPDAEMASGPATNQQKVVAPKKTPKRSNEEAGEKAQKVNAKPGQKAKKTGKAPACLKSASASSGCCNAMRFAVVSARDLAHTGPPDLSLSTQMIR